LSHCSLSSVVTQREKHLSAGHASLRSRQSKSFNFQNWQSYRVRGLFAQTRCRRFKIGRAVEQLRHSKAVSLPSQRLCLVPHTCRFLGRSSPGCRTDSEGDAIFTDGRSDQRSIAPPRSLSGSFCRALHVSALGRNESHSPPRVIKTTVQMRLLCQSQWQ